MMVRSNRTGVFGADLALKIADVALRFVRAITLGPAGTAGDAGQRHYLDGLF